ncbi:MAG: helix-turn-helix transcriptional regulator, partial [Moheibacter sp.]
MSIVNRILEILEKSGLTPSEFADKIGVQRSAISH